MKVEKEPDEFKHFPMEHCFFCDEPTGYWRDNGSLPVCRDCAAMRTEMELQQTLRHLDKREL